VAYGRKLDLEQPEVAAQVVAPLQAQAVVPLLVLVLLPGLVPGLVPGRQLVELRQGVLRRLARRLRVPPQPVWLWVQ
jgi:hypothetical protein